MAQTPFELVQEQAEKGLLKAPTISYGEGNIDPIGYQLSGDKFNLTIMSKGLKTRTKLSDIKKFYGLKGRTASDVLPQFMVIFNKYNERFK